MRPATRPSQRKVVSPLRCAGEPGRSAAATDCSLSHVAGGFKGSHAGDRRATSASLTCDRRLSNAPANQSSASERRLLGPQRLLAAQALALRDRKFGEVRVCTSIPSPESRLHVIASRQSGTPAQPPTTRFRIDPGGYNRGHAINSLPSGRGPFGGESFAGPPPARALGTPT